MVRKKTYNLGNPSLKGNDAVPGKSAVRSSGSHPQPATSHKDTTLDGATSDPRQQSTANSLAEDLQSQGLQLGELSGMAANQSGNSDEASDGPDTSTDSAQDLEGTETSMDSEQGLDGAQETRCSQDSGIDAVMATKKKMVLGDQPILAIPPEYKEIPAVTVLPESENRGHVTFRMNGVDDVCVIITDPNDPRFQENSNTGLNYRASVDSMESLDPGPDDGKW